MLESILLPLMFVAMFLGVPALIIAIPIISHVNKTKIIQSANLPAVATIKYYGYGTTGSTLGGERFIKITKPGEDGAKYGMCFTYTTEDGITIYSVLPIVQNHGLIMRDYPPGTKLRILYSRNSPQSGWKFPKVNGRYIVLSKAKYDYELPTNVQEEEEIPIEDSVPEEQKI